MSYYDEKQYYDELIRKARLERSLALGDAIGGLAAATWHGLQHLAGASARLVSRLAQRGTQYFAAADTATTRPSARQAAH